MRLNGLLCAALLAAATAPTLPTSAVAGDPSGVWARVDGKAKVRFGQCGSGYCGTIVWLQHPEGPGKIGEQVFFGMGQAGPNTWKGTAHNPEDGNDYDGSMTMSGNRLTTKGCAMGGMICKTVVWSRSR